MATPCTTVPTGISIFSPVVPLTGIVIVQNVFKREGIDISINTTNGVERDRCAPQLVLG